MFCAGCGNEMAASERFCGTCGTEVAVPLSVPSANFTAEVPATSGKAVASLVCGLFFFILPASILAVIFGHLSHSEIRKSQGRLKGDGMAIAGMVLGYVGVAALPVILIIAAIALPNILRARIAANESSAAATVQTLVAAEMQYSATHPESGYTCNLSDLSNAGLIHKNLAGGRRFGYSFELLGCSASTEGAANDHFRVVAFPLTPNGSGKRAFCSDESNVIKIDASGSPQNCMSSAQTL